MYNHIHTKQMSKIKFDRTPEQVAKELKEIDFSPERYENEVQARRLTRLAFWKERKIQALIDREQELVDYGNLVLEEMRKLN